MDGVRRERFRKKNRERQYSGSPVKEKKGFMASLLAPKYSSRAEAIGDHGEKRVSSFLEYLDCEDYWVFNDILILNGKYTTQIDHIIISRFGVFVLETKNVHGKVYGNENSEFWKQFLPDIGYRRYGFTQEHHLRNPIWQNEGHIKTLRRLVFGSEIPIYGVILFSGGTELFITTNQPVLNMWEVVPYIKQYRSVVLTSEQMNYYRNRLLSVISISSADREKHLDNVYRNMERRDESVLNGRCPRCGGKLVLRTGKYGSFYGCSNYPQCKYTLNK